MCDGSGPVEVVPPIDVQGHPPVPLEVAEVRRDEALALRPDRPVALGGLRPADDVGVDRPAAGRLLPQPRDPASATPGLLLGAVPGLTHRDPCRGRRYAGSSGEARSVRFTQHRSAQMSCSDSSSEHGVGSPSVSSAPSICHVPSSSARV